MGGQGYGFGDEHDDALRASALATGSEQHELAGWWSRVGAYLLDVIILVIVLAILIGIAAAISKALLVVVLILGLVVFYLGYWTYFEGGESGQTIGKRAAGIRVRSDSGGRASYGQAFGRNIVARVIALLPLIGLLDVLWPLWDTRKQCLHDKAASTIVVRA